MDGFLDSRSPGTDLALADSGVNGSRTGLAGCDAVGEWTFVGTREEERCPRGQEVRAPYVGKTCPNG
jgi:hypothetical protein